MEHEVSLRYLQERAIGAYLKPEEFSPHTDAQLLKIHFNITNPPTPQSSG
jgi:hypothetical protein